MSKKLTKLIAGGLSYNETAKKLFHREGKRVLKQVASRLGLESGTYQIRSNQGGIAVSGEVTLHSDDLYIQLSDSSFGNLFMWRTCDHQKDYTGHTNQWMSFQKLEDLDAATEVFRRAMEREREHKQAAVTA